MTENWEKHYAVLSGAERDDPIDVLLDYCQNDNVFGVRERLFSMLKAAMGSEDWQHDNPRDKSNRMYFFQMLLQLIEATYLINDMIEDESLTYQIWKKQDSLKK